MIDLMNGYAADVLRFMDSISMARELAFILIASALQTTALRIDIWQNRAMPLPLVNSSGSHADSAPPVGPVRTPPLR
jgi:hypothetical protein